MIVILVKPKASKKWRLQFLTLAYLWADFCKNSY